ncbi:Protein kinase domain [Paramecium bursaria]
MNQIEKVIELIGRPKPEDLEIISAPMAQSVLDNIQMQKEKSFAGFFPNASPDAVEFIRQCLDWNPHKRINVEQALRHPLMKEFANTEDEKTLKNIIKVPFNDNKKFSIKDYRDKIHNGCQVLQELNKTKEIKQYNSQPSTIYNYLQNYEAKRVEKMKTEQTTKVDVSIEKKPSTSQTKLDQSPQPKKPIQTYSQLLQQKYIQNTKKPSISKPVVQYESKSPELKKRDQPTQPVTKSFSFHTEGNEKRPVSSNKPYETKPNISSNAIKYTGTSQSFHQPKEKPIIQTQVQSQAIRSKSFEKSPIAVGPTSPFGRQKTALEKPKFGVQSNLKTNQDIPNSISQVQKLLQRCSQLSNNYVHKKTVTHYTEPSRPPYHTVNYNYFDIRNSKFM